MSTKTVKPPVKARKPKLWYKSDEIAHVWANEGAPEGKSPGNMSFSGTGFWSYSTCIARIMHTKKGERVYVRDHTSFSSNTGKTQSKLWRAIDKDAIKFSAGDGRRGQSMNYTPESLRDYYLAKFNHTEPKQMAHERAAMTVSRYNNLDEAIRVCEVFGLPKKELMATRRRGKADVDEAREIVRLHEEKRDAKRKARDAKQQAARIAEHEQMALTYMTSHKDVKFSGSLELLSEHRPALYQKLLPVITQRSAGAIKAWLAGETNEADYSWPLMLRREGNEVVSSQGARVPLADAERTYRFIEKVKARGWHANGEQHQVGAYALRHVRSDVVQIGCHTISLEECQRFAESQGWTVSK